MLAKASPFPVQLVVITLLSNPLLLSYPSGAVALRAGGAFCMWNSFCFIEQVRKCCCFFLLPLSPQIIFFSMASRIFQKGGPCLTKLKYLSFVLFLSVFPLSYVFFPFCVLAFSSVEERKRQIILFYERCPIVR